MSTTSSTTLWKGAVAYMDAAVMHGRRPTPLPPPPPPLSLAPAPSLLPIGACAAEVVGAAAARQTCRHQLRRVDLPNSLASREILSALIQKM